MIRTATSPPRLVHVTTVPLSLTFLRGQVAFMKARGFEVAAISSPGELLDRFGEEEAIDVAGVEMRRRITPVEDLRAMLRLRRHFKRLHPAIVHAHTPKGGLLGVLGALLAGVPVRVYHMRGLPMVTATGLRRHLLRWSERLTCLAAHEVLCVSHSLRQVAVSEGLCPPHKIKVLGGGSGNGIDAARRFDPAAVGADTRQATRARYGIPDEATVIGFVGRLVRDKGVVELLEAWRTLARERPDLHLLVVGMREERDALPHEAIDALTADPRIHWQGENWDTPPLYAAMDVVALPTYREGFPNVPLEAAAMRLPIVATRIPGCVDAIEDGETGLLVSPRDAGALTEALRRYLDAPQLRVQHGRAARERVTRLFQQEALWTALFTEYQQLLARRGLPPVTIPAQDHGGLKLS